MEKELASLKHIRQAQYISKDSAKSLMLQHVGEDAFDILDGSNPIPSSIHVNLSSEYVNPDSAAIFAERIMKDYEHLVSDVSYSKSQFLEIGAVFKNFELILLIIAGILLLISIILINITIRLAIYSKRFIIRTMQLVGAKSSFIRRPFMINAVFYGFVAGCLAIITLIGLWHLFSSFNPEIVAKMSSNKEELESHLEVFGMFFIGILLSGVFISLFSTYFALNKYIWINSEKLY